MSKVITFLLIIGLVVPARADSTSTKEFITACTYGVLAGTLVGAATLAFTDKPGDNLNNIARGASFGLYAGILLGLYLVYGVPSETPEGEQGPSDTPTNPDNGTDQPQTRLRLPIVFPIISQEHGLEGVQASFTVLKF